MSIRENLEAIRAEIDAAARETGRTGADITLVGASKMNDAAACQEAIAAGIDALGENRVQEMTAKLAEDAYRGAPLHFIGHLQRNKVKQVVGKAVLIHSVDSLHLAEKIEQEAAKRDLTADILLEVNVAREESKFGLMLEEVIPLLEEVKNLPHVRVRGLMTIAPNVENPEENRKHFKKLYQLYVDIKNKNIDNGTVSILSMGMTNDFEVAIEEGATMVRIGTAIFGERNYAHQI